MPSLIMASFCSHVPMPTRGPKFGKCHWNVDKYEDGSKNKTNSSPLMNGVEVRKEEYVGNFFITFSVASKRFCRNPIQTLEFELYPT